MDASHVITEFIYFHLPAEVKPENIQDQKGRRLLDLFQEAKLQDGYNWSAWGRSEEDANALVWVIGELYPPATHHEQLLLRDRAILSSYAKEVFLLSNLEWSNELSTISTTELKNLACSSPAIFKLRTKLTPTLSSVGGIKSAPMVDLTTMPFVAGLSVEDDAGTREVLNTMREAVLNKLPEDLAPSYWLMSTWDTRPVVPHPESPTGRSVLSILVVGWQSTQQHYDIWKLPDFRSTYIGPVKAKMLSYPEGLGMKHIAFNLI